MEKSLRIKITRRYCRNDHIRSNARSRQGDGYAFHHSINTIEQLHNILVRYKAITIGKPSHARFVH